MPKQPSILLIEDEANLRQNLTVLLEGEGYRVCCAENGAEGIHKLQEEPFDLVITDVVMPEVDGFQVMEYLKDRVPDVVVVAITAYVSTESAIEALRHGAYDYLAKPFDVDLMQMVIRRALEKARMQKAFRHSMGELEHQVEERTRHLADANIHLQQAMEELRSTQEQLIQARKFCALGEATADVAPELAESLAMIVGFAQVLARIAPTESSMKTQLEQVGDVAFRCHEIVKNLANFPWRQTPQKIPMQLNDSCEQMLAELAYQTDLNHVVVHRRLDAGIPLIMGDPQQLLQAFINIALNACQSMTNYRDSGRLTIESKRTGSVIQVAFQVSGLGVTNGFHERLLEPFLTNRERTGGLGLSFAYRTIKEHQGKMAIHNIPGEGVTYVVELPIRESLPSQLEPPSHGLEAVERCRVLVVDADEKSLALLHEVVRHLGHDADESSSAQQALQKIVDRAYDLIITDLNLPNEDNLHLYQRLILLRPELAQRVIFISAGLLSEKVSGFLEGAGCPLIRNPFSVADIEAGIRQVLGA